MEKRRTRQDDESQKRTRTSIFGTITRAHEVGKSSGPPMNAAHLAGQTFPELAIRKPAAQTTTRMLDTLMAEKQLPKLAGHMLTAKEQGQVRMLRTTNS